MSCDGCHTEAKELNKQINDLIIKAKDEAVKVDKPQAICYDEVSGLFTTDAYTAVREKYQIRQVISNV